jgi:hypothetical protein
MVIVPAELRKPDSMLQVFGEGKTKAMQLLLPLKTWFGITRRAYLQPT